MDVIYTNEKLANNLENILIKGMCIEKEKISKNGNVTSFLCNPLGYGEFQVDLIYMSHENYQCALDYYSYNDMGNLRGRIAHSLGLKLGHDGLSYIHRDGDQICFKINLSKNWQEIDAFLGFPENLTHKIVKRGPDTLEDIFEYIASSKFFNPEIFLLENRNHISRVRDKKRKTYTEFLKWCGKLPDQTYYVRPPDKTGGQMYALDFFGKIENFNYLLSEHNTRKAIKAKLNGNVVMERTNLEGKTLGHFMSFLDQHLCDGLILSVSKETLDKIIDDVFEVYKGAHNVTQKVV